MYHIGIDLGGTNIKAGIIDDIGQIVISDSVPTNIPRSGEDICDDICELTASLLGQSNLSLDDIADIGVGCPGTCNIHTGIIEYSNNLQWRDFNLRKYLQHKMSVTCPVYVENDANVAAIGEYFAGGAKGAQSAVVITIGTGIGSGMIFNSQLITGHYYGGGEFGHTVIEIGGRQCTCGRRGCLEAYASATGLINLTKEEMERCPDSKMWNISQCQGKVNGRTAFDAMRQDDAAGSMVVDAFIEYLACGVTNIVNSIQPEIICIGGGVCNEGDTILIPLRERVYREAYGMTEGKKNTELRVCTLGNNAGIIGAGFIGKLA